jgi:hypothetical protein
MQEPEISLCTLHTPYEVYVVVRLERICQTEPIIPGTIQACSYRPQYRYVTFCYQMQCCNILIKITFAFVALYTYDISLVL